MKFFLGRKLPPIEELRGPQKKGSRFVASAADLYVVFGNGWLWKMTNAAILARTCIVRL